MASESELSSHASENGDDSDTIVISSKSRILISPRKKGSKAVSRLLGSAAAADDIVESILRGSGTGADVQVVHREKKATVSMEGTTEQLRSGKKTTSSSSTREASAHHRSTKSSDSNHTSQRKGSRETSSMKTVHTSHRSRHGATADEDSHSSDVDSDISAPSSAEDVHSAARTKKVDIHTRRRSTKARGTSKTTHSAHNNLIAQGFDDVGTESDHENEDYESDASSFSKDFSRSDDHDTHRHRKFDDQLRPAAATNSHSRTHKSVSARTKHTATHNKSRSRQATSSDLDDSVLLPKTATQEMEDLKQTLKNLAHQEPAATTSSAVANSAFTLANVPKKTHSSARREELATPVWTSRHSDAAWAATTAHSRIDKSSTHHTTRSKSSRPVSYSDDDSGSEHEPTVARRLFSTPPTAKSTKTASFSTPPTVPISTKLTPSPRSASYPSMTGYTSVLDMSLTTAAASSAQGSRAVLSALKALQDKIRRLEEERERLLQELSDLKVKARKREAEFASAEKKFAYEIGQSKESARAAYDALRTEKEELKLELVKYEERRKAAEAEIQHAHKLTTTYSAKADDLQSQLQLSESQSKSLHAELDATNAAHKQEMRDLRGELTVLQKDRDMAREQTKLVQSQLDRELQSHTETRERLHEAEQTVGGITQLNEKLVAKVWEANEIATKATKKSKKLLQTQRVSTLSRPTAASRAASISGVNGSATPGRPGSASVQKARSGSITAKRTGSIKKEKRPSQLLATNNLELLRAANMGREIPFVLGTSANRSHSIISNAQEAIRQCDTTYARPVTNPPPTPAHLKAKRSSKKPASVRGESSYPNTTASSAASILGLTLNQHNTTSDTLLGTRPRPREDGGGSTAQPGSNRPSAIRVPTPSTSYANPMQSQIMENLDVAVHTAEREFQTLNQRYKAAVARVERGRDGASQLSTELGGMLDELEAKGKQLNLLKQVYEQAARSTINPIRHIVHSPEAVRRKTASLRILNDYRQMEREARSPRSAATTPGMPASPNGTNTTSRRASFFSDDD